MAQQETSRLIPLRAGDILIHKKGNYYKVLETELVHSETLELMVEYRAMYGDCVKWVRPRSMFTADRFKLAIPHEHL